MEQMDELNTSEWIAFPDEFLNGKYSGFSMSPYRLFKTPKIDAILALNLERKLVTYSKDLLGRKFIGYIPWKSCVEINLLLGQKLPSIKDMHSFLLLLDEGIKEKISVYNVAGKKLDKDYLLKIQRDIIEPNNIWRAEWLEDKYEKVSDFVQVTNDFHFSTSGALIPRYNKLIFDNTLMQKNPLYPEKISLSSWLKNSTELGLPSQDVDSGNLIYFSMDRPGVGKIATTSSEFIFHVSWPENFCMAYLGFRAIKKIC